MSEVWPLLRPFKDKFFNGSWPTITQMFRLVMSGHPDNVCFSSLYPENLSFTYSQVWSLIEKVASCMMEKGVVKGDKVLLWGTNSVMWAVSYFAINYCGAVAVPVDAQSSIEKISNFATFAECSFVISDSAFLDRISSLEWFSSLKGCLSLRGKSDLYVSVLDSKPQKVRPQAEISEDSLAVILFTSGTTSNEKAVMLSNKNIVSDTYIVGETMRGKDTDVMYAVLPLHHSYCCTTVLLYSVSNGANCLFGKDLSLSRMIRDMKKGNVSVFMGIPLIFNKLLHGIIKKEKEKGILNYALFNCVLFINGFFKNCFNIVPFSKVIKKHILEPIGFDKINFVICGAGPLSPKVFRKYNQLGLDFLQGYGLTECSPVITVNPRDHYIVSSIGTALSTLDVKLADVNKDGVGEIRVKGDVVTAGYYKEPEQTKLLFDEDGYLKTGDLAKMDRHGYFYICGREKNIIVTEGGKNVYPEEIEDMFQSFQEIEQVLIKGFKASAKSLEEEIEAVFYPCLACFEDMDNSEIYSRIQKIVDLVNEKLLVYQRIHKIVILDQRMEETSTRKIKRSTVNV